MEAELMREMNEARQMQFAKEQEDKVFKSWAEKCIETWSD